MAATTETAASPEPVASTPKFSRYRSVRRAQAQQKEAQEQEHSSPIAPIPPIPAVPPVSAIPEMPSSEFQRDAPVSRSMSRYHRRPTTSSAQKPQIAAPVATAPVPTVSTASRSRAQSSSQHSASNPRAHESAPLPNTSRTRGEPSQAAREEAKLLIEQETERQRRMQEKLKAQRRAKLEAQEREAEAAERERRMREEEEHQRQLQQAESAARAKKEEEEEVHRARLRKKAPDEAHHARSPPSSPHRHGLHLFGRRRKDDTPSSPETQTQIEQPRMTSDSYDREHNVIRPGGGGAVPGIDAPVSAVNADEDRRVLVVRNKQEILLPVTLETTALDLIKSAANCLTDPINVRTAALIEHYQKVGVTRPLRNYESVRDVLNSWDDNKSNLFRIVDAPFENIDQDELLVLGVPDKKLALKCWMYYSSKPGKWSKRYVTLSDEGQLAMAKNVDGKDQQNVCHLTDFDVYTPTERKLSKVKPPKKICYAVKSQQRSNIYVDETRFVHFFCSNDKAIASEFYKAIQGWRSWYLVHVLGEGRKHHKPAAQEPKPTSRNASGNSQHVRNSSVSSHYQLGSFMPLLDLDQFSAERREEDGHRAEPVLEGGSAPLGRLDSKTMHARKMSTRAKGPPPLSYHLGALGQDSAAPHPQQKEDHASRSNTLSETESETFAPGGLLGRRYTERRRALQESEAKKADAFTEGPSLVHSKTWTTQTAGNENGLARQSSVRSHHRRTSSDIQRSMSTRNRPIAKPLVDLTPQYREPPQHARKGKGFHPEANAGPLVENATSPEEAIKLPPSTTFRAPPPARPAYERTKSLKGRGEGLAAYTVNNHSGAPEDDSIAFTGGLLARTGFSQGRTPVGHGVMDGSKARGPMLDLREPSKFAAGSLLANVERQHGPPGAGNKRHSVDLG